MYAMYPFKEPSQNFPRIFPAKNGSLIRIDGRIEHNFRWVDSTASDQF